MQDVQERLCIHIKITKRFVRVNVMEVKMRLIMKILRHAEKLGLDKEKLLTMPLIDAMLEIQEAESMWKTLMKEIPPQ